MLSRKDGIFKKRVQYIEFKSFGMHRTIQTLAL